MIFKGDSFDFVFRNEYCLSMFTQWTSQEEKSWSGRKAITKIPSLCKAQYISCYLIALPFFCLSQSYQVGKQAIGVSSNTHWSHQKDSHAIWKLSDDSAELERVNILTCTEQFPILWANDYRYLQHPSFKNTLLRVFLWRTVYMTELHLFQAITRKVDCEQ